MNPILVFVTVPDEIEGRKISRILVEERLAACVSLVPGLISTYRWQEKIEVNLEVGLTIKTSRELWSRISARIRELHSYECPEIVSIQIQDSDPAYLRWWTANLSL